MPLVFGINHNTASVAVREKLAFTASELFDALQNLTQHPTINEAVILSTCNRTEIYTNATQPILLQEWLMQQKTADLSQYCYTYHDANAIRHIMRVASGLDSMVLGEPQILGQMKQAYAIAQNAGTIGAVLKHLFPAVFETSKQIRTETEIGTHSVSIAYAITQLSKNIYETIQNCQVLFIGAGETIELIATQLHGMGVKKIIIANRTREKTRHIVDHLQAKAIGIQDIPTYLKETDIVISATASQLPILGKGMIETTLQHKQNKPLLLIDLAVPRDIEPEVATLNHVYLYNIDDLQNMISHNLKNKMAAAKQAEMIIECQTSRFLQKMRVFHARHIITQYRARLEKMCLEEQEKAMLLLQQGKNPEGVLTQFGNQLINKIMHHPTIKLREAAAMEKCSALQDMKEFFEIG